MQMSALLEPPIIKVALIGNPNVGKSVVFRFLTGRYVTVSNYPGTTVEVYRGRIRTGESQYEVLDTPGINSLVPQSPDERVTCEILLKEKPDCVIQVADAKNLRRTLLVTSQLVEFGIPTILILNMMDEARDRGVEIDHRGIAELFGIPVFESVAIDSQGLKQLSHALRNLQTPRNPIKDDPWVHRTLVPLNGKPDVPIALLVEWLGQEDGELDAQVEESLGRDAFLQLKAALEIHQRSHDRSLVQAVAEKRNEFLDWAVNRFKRRRQTNFIGKDEDTNSRVWLLALLSGIFLFAWNEVGALFHYSTPYLWATDLLTERLAHLSELFMESTGMRVAHSILFGTLARGRFKFGLISELLHFLLIIAPVVVPLAVLIRKSQTFVEKMGILSRRALTGIPILIGVLLLVYEFVGYTGAQTLVGLLEDALFAQHLVPFLQSLIPRGFIYDLLVGPYGLVSMGLSYSIAIVLPVVATFFIAFGLLEDSGYLPRLSILSDRVMRAMGLNGKAVLPMVLGLGCCTMATMTTRILSSRKERLIATILLALGVPCSAQLGVILGIAAGFTSGATLTVLGVVVSQLLLVGYLSSLLIRGERSGFIFEIPPIRVPRLRNLALKTGYRVQWYVREAVPLFLYGTLALFVLDKVHLKGRSFLEWIQSGLEPLLSQVLHLPPQAAGVFVLGFLRRDYGAAGLFDMARSGSLTAQQAVVSLIVITLFVPCLASFLVIAKEHGLKRALAITGFIIPYAIAVGGVVSWILRTFNITFG